MDVSLRDKAHGDMKESLHEDDQQSIKSSSSSVYSSANTTPTCTNDPSGAPAASIDQPDGQVQSAQLPNPEPAAKAYYEDLITESKQRMTTKFNELEEETGIKLNHNGRCLEDDPQINDMTNTPVCTSLPKGGLPLETNVCSRLRDLEYVRMEKELKRLKEEVKLKNEIVDKMCRIRSQVESELEDLTVSLFEEANKMVYQANVLRDRAEKDLIEANLKIDMLSAEVDALKVLVITSTPSRPNAHLHPQLNSPRRNKKSDSTKDDDASSKAAKQPSMPTKSPSNYELGANHKEKTVSSQGSDVDHSDELNFLEDASEIGEIDPLYFEEFIEWRKMSLSLDPMKSDFMKRIYDEEVYPVFNFKNKNLTASVLRCIEDNSLTVESLATDAFPRKCALLEASKTCSHRMKLKEDRWYAISQLSRNRIAAVCDLFSYLGYIKNGLVKSDARQMYWQIMRRRHSIVTSKLGFHPSPQ